MTSYGMLAIVNTYFRQQVGRGEWQPPWRVGDVQAQLY